MVVIYGKSPVAITQDEFDNKLSSSSKLLADLDSDANTKLSSIETGAKADQTGAEIKAAYEAEANAYTDTKDTKLAGIEAGAEANVGEEFTTPEKTKVSKIGTNTVLIEVLDAEPGTPVEGNVYYDDVALKLKRYNGTTWDIVQFVMDEAI